MPNGQEKRKASLVIQRLSRKNYLNKLRAKNVINKFRLKLYKVKEREKSSKVIQRVIKRRLKVTRRRESCVKIQSLFRQTVYNRKENYRLKLLRLCFILLFFSFSCFVKCFSRFLFDTKVWRLQVELNLSQLFNKRQSKHLKAIRVQCLFIGYLTRKRVNKVKLLRLEAEKKRLEKENEFIVKKMKGKDREFSRIIKRNKLWRAKAFKDFVCSQEKVKIKSNELDLTRNKRLLWKYKLYVKYIFSFKCRKDFLKLHLSLLLDDEEKKQRFLYRIEQKGKVDKWALAQLTL